MNNRHIDKVFLEDFNILKITGNNLVPFYGYLYVNDQEVMTSKIHEDNNEVIFKIEENIELLGQKVILSTFENEQYEVDDSLAVDFDDFDNRYYYDGKLGSIYHKEYTEFALYAPLAKKAFVFIDDNYFPMKRENNGVFKLNLIGDYEGKLYRYKILINGNYIEVNDPYAYSGNVNNEFSCVIDLNKLDFDTCDNRLPPFNSYLEAIIYELNIRDFTIDEHTDIVHKGKFLGLSESGRSTDGGNKAGLDYLEMLNISHVQLMPILNIATIDDYNCDKTYNWGYDPEHFFTLEGSYSTLPRDPYSRMKEFKILVRELHKKGIRVNLDVVFNHIYKVETSTLNKITPNYYFRRDKDGFLNHSYCGNEFASERKMVRKLFLDSLLFLVNTYHVDGFRFDLMSLIDIDTMNLIDKELRFIKKDIMLYGEGWKMFTKTKDNSLLAELDNSNLMKNFAFFNDRYRNIVRGPGFKSILEEKGYFLGNKEYEDGFKFAYMGSSFDLTFPKLFSNLNQSINYIECHDNATIFDVVNSMKEIDDPLRIVKKLNKLLLLSFGIPFIHSGQEIGLSKFNHHNTYNEGDKFNKFDYSMLDERFDMVSSFISYIKARREIKIFSCADLDLIAKNVDFKSENNLLHIKINDIDENNTIYHIFINPNDDGYRLEFNPSLKFYFPKCYKKANTNMSFNHIDISPLQVSIFIENKQ